MALVTQDLFVSQDSGASDENGGYPLGTNDGPVLTVAACTSAADGLTIVDDAAGDWTGASVGDYVQFDTGGTQDIARITDITTDTITVTPAVATTAAAKEVKVGGAWASLTFPLANILTTHANAAGDPPGIKIAPGTYNLTASMDRTADMTHEIPLYVFGVDSSWNVQPIYTYPTAIFDIVDVDDDVLIADGNYVRWRHLKFVGNGGNVGGRTAKSQDGVIITAKSNHFLACVADDIGRAGFKPTSGADGTAFILCEADRCGQNTVNFGFLMDGNSEVWLCLGCFAHDCTGYGFSRQGTYGGSMIGCISANNSIDGFRDTKTDTGQRLAVYVNCIAYSNGADGWDCDLGTANGKINQLINCMAVQNGAHGLASHATGKSEYKLLGMAFQGNLTAEVDANAIVEDIIPRVSLVGDPFVDGANYDFRLTPAAKSQLMESGFPQKLLINEAVSSWSVDPAFGLFDHRILPRQIIYS